MTNKKDKVAIIILNYNGYKDTIECLNSLMRLNCSSVYVSVFIIDNGSTNSSVDEIIKWMKYNIKDFSIIHKEEKITSQVAFYIGTKNLGFSGGNNIGIRLAEKSDMDYVLLLNNDTVVDPNFLEPLLEVARSDSRIGIVGSKIIDYFHRDHYILGGYLSLKKCSGYHFYNTERANKGKLSFTSGCIWLLPIHVFKKCGVMDPKYFLYVEDVDFCYNVSSHGYIITCNKDSVIYHKEGQSSIIKPTVAYYNTRNRLYFSNKVKGHIFSKSYFYIYFFVTRILKIIRNPSLAKYIGKGILDYRRKFYGKYNS